MDYNEAKSIIYRYILDRDDIPDKIEKALILLINNANIAESRMKNPLSNRAFVNSVISEFQKLDAAEKINYFRNLFYKEPDTTVEGLVANAINDYIPPLMQDYKHNAEKIAKALSIAFQYGQIDGDHHKAWVIDQMVRALIGNDTDYKL